MENIQNFVLQSSLIKYLLKPTINFEFKIKSKQVDIKLILALKLL